MNTRPDLAGATPLGRERLLRFRQGLGAVGQQGHAIIAEARIERIGQAVDPLAQQPQHQRGIARRRADLDREAGDIAIAAKQARSEAAAAFAALGQLHRRALQQKFQHFEHILGAGAVHRQVDQPERPSARRQPRLQLADPALVVGRGADALRQRVAEGHPQQTVRGQRGLVGPRPGGGVGADLFLHAGHPRHDPAGDGDQPAGRSLVQVGVDEVVLGLQPLEQGAFSATGGGGDDEENAATLNVHRREVR